MFFVWRTTFYNHADLPRACGVRLLRASAYRVVPTARPEAWRWSGRVPSRVLGGQVVGGSGRGAFCATTASELWQDAPLVATFVFASRCGGLGERNTSSAGNKRDEKTKVGDLWMNGRLPPLLLVMRVGHAMCSHEKPRRVDGPLLPTPQMSILLIMCLSPGRVDASSSLYYRRYGCGKSTGRKNRRAEPQPLPSIAHAAAAATAAVSARSCPRHTTCTRSTSSGRAKAGPPERRAERTSCATVLTRGRTRCDYSVTSEVSLLAIKKPSVTHVQSIYIPVNKRPAS